MASIFEQYETQQRVQGQHDVGNAARNSSVATAMFKSLKLEDDSAIFSKQKINFQPAFNIVDLVVSNNKLVVAMANNVLIRINLLHAQDIEEIDISRHCPSDTKVFKLFLDPSGSHLLVSLVGDKSNLDTLYIPWQSKKVRCLGKLRNHTVSSVAWSQRNSSELLTGPVLCGTINGLIFELEISADESLFQSGFDPYCKQLVKLFKAELIGGLEILPCPTSDLQYVILCSTKSRLYTFKGQLVSTESRPFFADLFAEYKDDFNNFTEYKGSSNSSILKVYYQPSTMMAASIAWTNGQGILYAQINWNSNNIINDVKLIKVTRDPGSSKLLSQVDTGLVLTPFHMLIPHENEISVVCTISEKVIMNDRIPGDCGPSVGISQDSVKGSIWLFTEKAIFKCKMDREDRNVWNMHLDEGRFELAKKYCYGDQYKLLQVRIKEAENLFEKGEYVESAKLFAHTIVPFEQVLFKLNSVSNDAGLRVYLLEKLSTLSNQEQGQFSLVTLIMLEYYFNRLGQVRDETSEYNEEYYKVNEEFEAFLRKPRILETLEMNSNAVYHMLSSHADKTNIIKISLLIKAYDRVVTHLININKHMDALDILTQHASEDVFLRHISTLLKVIPVPTIDVIIKKGHKLDPLKVIPILVEVHASKGCKTEIMRYLDHCINVMERTDSVVHNFLITIYATECPDNLLPYLKMQGDNMECVSYDAKLALRECILAKQDVAAVHILTVMGLYQEAVELALKSDIDLAKATADRQRNNPQVCKKLWLLITQYVVDQTQDVEKALAIMKECELIKIEDVLPFFPDLITIDFFKDAICQSLKEYNKEIERLKEEMDDASNIADGMRADIQVLKQQSTTVGPEDSCSECGTLLLDRPFYMFQCNHKFHQDCLSEVVMEYLTVTESHQLKNLKSKLVALSSDDGRMTKSVWEQRQSLKEQLHDIVACECLHCGERIVDAIDKPFIPDEDFHKVLDEWN